MELEQHGHSLVVRLAGELDLVAAAEFRRRVDELLDRRRVRNLYVNLEAVGFLDSSFLGAMLGRYRRIHSEGGRMGLIGASPSLRPTLEISGLYRTMAEFRTEEEALAGA